MIWKKRPINKIFADITAAIAAVALACSMVYFFTIQISKISRTIQEKKELSYLLKNRETTIAAIKRDLSLVDSGYEEIIGKALPSADNILPFIESLEGISDKNSLNQSYKFGIPAVSAASGLSLYSVDFYLNIGNANIVNLTRYLDDFERLPFFAVISTINLSSPDAGGWLDDSAANMTGKVYVRQ